MPHLVSNQPWGTVDIVLHEGRVFFQQDWFYEWQVRPPMAAWSTEEKRNLHNTMDRQIWGVWSNRIRIPVRLGPAPDARSREFVSRTGGSVPINFDIHWVLRPGHYRVTAVKTRPGSEDRSEVSFDTRTITFYSHDLAPSGAQNEAGRTTNNFRTAPHEFGHTIAAPDEYMRSSPNLSDAQSIMNIGSRVRPRHLQLIVNTLNSVMPGCVFTAPAA